MYNFLFSNRFEIFLITQVLILFGSLFFPSEQYEDVMMPVFFLLNIIAGILIVSKHKTKWIIIGFFFLASVFFGLDTLKNYESDKYLWARLAVYFVFYIMVTLNIIKQVWYEKEVNKKVIFGLMSGYISLGFLAFFLFLSIEMATPNSFTGTLLDQSKAFNLRMDSILYYAYIILLTIGYGEIVPATPVAQKASILVGLVGQFYIAIITAVVVEKYFRFITKNGN